MTAAAVVSLAIGTSFITSTIVASRAFPAEVVALGPIHTASHFKRDEQGYVTRELVSCKLSRTFSVRHEDVRMVAKATGEVTELLQGGTQVQSSTPEYVFTKLADLKIEMLGLATANARERAERIVGESRCRLGAVSDARAGVLQITPPGRRK